MKKLHLKIYTEEDNKLLYSQALAGGLPAQRSEVIELDGLSDEELYKKVFINSIAVVIKTLYPNDFNSKITEAWKKHGL